MFQDTHDGHEGHEGHGDSGGHAGHGGGSGCSMSMIFHAGHSECIIFSWWNVKSLEAFIFSAIGIFLITVIYEGIKYYREKLYTDKAIAIKASARNLTEGVGNSVVFSLRQQIFNRAHVLQTGLHMVQMAISYALMLIAMTYNAWLILAVILGAGCGYFAFGWVRQRSVEAEEHCH